MPLALAVAMMACKTETQEEQYKDDIKFKPEAAGYLISSQTGDTLTELDLELAEDDFSRQTGLMYRDGMERDQGMLFLFDEDRRQAFYMKNTRFPLDIIYIRKDSTVESFYQNTTPLDETSLPSEGPVSFVLELNAGEVARLDLQKGDTLKWIDK